jgi:hypothetical protein
VERRALGIWSCWREHSTTLPRSLTRVSRSLGLRNYWLWSHQLPSSSRQDNLPA